MRYELFIGLRYLRAKRKEAFISLITVISIARRDDRRDDAEHRPGGHDRLRGGPARPHPRLQPARAGPDFGGTLNDYPGIVEKIRTVPEVTAAAPFVYGQVMLSAQQNVTGVVVRGVPPEPDGVLDLQRHLKQGSTGGPRPAARRAARRGQGRHRRAAGHHPRQGRGATARRCWSAIRSASSRRSARRPRSGMVPRVKRFVVVGMFDSGMSEYDSRWSTWISPARSGSSTSATAVTGIEVRGTTSTGQRARRARTAAPRLSVPRARLDGDQPQPVLGPEAREDRLLHRPAPDRPGRRASTSWPRSSWW